MARLSDEKIRDGVSRMARQLYSLTSLRDLGDSIAAEIRGLIGHDSHLFCEAELRTGESIYYSEGIGDPLRQHVAQIQAYFSQVPFLQHYAKQSRVAAVRTYDIISPSRWRRTELFNEALEPMDLIEQLGLKIPAAPGRIRGLMLNRERVGFSERDMAVLNLLKDHIDATVGIVEQWRRLEQGSPPAEGGAGGRRASLVLDRRSRVLLWSPGARALLNDYAPPPALPPDALPALVEGWALQAIHRQASRDLWQYPRQPLLIPHSDAVLTLRLSSSLDSQCHLLLLEESRQPRSWSDPIHRLSPREQEVLSWIAEGKTNEEIAQILGMSVYTVKNHVKRILDTLGVGNRTAAATIWHQAREV